jgi:FtsP/CotA-like multicopper oxidase with cupredoxin domain
MSDFNSRVALRRLAMRAVGWIAVIVAGTSQAAVPGITGPSFDLVAAPGYTSQPDGASIYSWGFGCNTAPAGFAPATIANPKCLSGQMQLPGPTLIVTEGQVVTVKLTNKLPAAAGNTSILFPGMDVSTTLADPGSPGLLTQEATTNGGTVTYSFTAKLPGTHAYYSGTQGDLQVEMGLFGALIVLPDPALLPDACNPAVSPSPKAAMQMAQTSPRLGYFTSNPKDFRLAKAAFNHPSACYDREYLFQFSEMDPRIHRQALEQSGIACSAPTGCMTIDTEPYHAVYFLINGRSMPDLADPNYAPQYPLQPYNGNPHMHPGEMTLARIIGQGRMQHPFHEHANHVRVLARDGNPLLTSSNKLAGPLLFTTTTTPGQTIDALFQWTAKGLNWDVYAHVDGATTEVCTADANGYHSVPTDNHFYEWCADHKKPLESKPFGAVGSGGPVTLPDPNILANGAWYAGSPYFGPDATARAAGPTPIPPFGTIANDPGSEAGFAYMWHSHNEREITTNNIFPGGMMMMMMVDPWVFLIDEAN